MKNDDLLRLSAEFLKNKQIAFLEPGHVLRREDGQALISFPVPESLDPMVVCDPSDVRVLIHFADAVAMRVVQM